MVSLAVYRADFARALRRRICRAELYRWGLAMNDRIKEIRARLEKATPGPWLPGPHYGVYKTLHINHMPGEKALSYSDVIASVRPYGVDDQSLIANAPADLAFLLGEIERLERIQHEFKNFHRNLCKRFNYTHDERDWKRDQLSLEEHIAADRARLTAQLKVAVEGLEFECGGRCAHQNPCNARETLAKIAEMEGK